MRQVFGAGGEMLLLRETCEVMRNLLRDVIENESSTQHLAACVDLDEARHLCNDKMERRQALCAEINYYLFIDGELFSYMRPPSRASGFPPRRPNGGASRI